MFRFCKTEKGKIYGWFIAKHEGGNLLNELEYLTDENNLIRLFDTKEDAISFLKKRGYIDNDINDLRFFVHTVCLNCCEQQNVHELDISEDSLGLHTICDNCLSSFDVTY